MNSAVTPADFDRLLNGRIALDADSKVVQLSTCMLDSSQGNSRYIVSGVLTNDQETK